MALLIGVMILMGSTGCRNIWPDMFSSEFTIEFFDIKEIKPEIIAQKDTERQSDGQNDSQTETETDSPAKAERASGGTSEYTAYETVEIEEDTALSSFSASASRFEACTLNEADYYQYSALSQKEKSVYKEMAAAVRQGKTTVRLRELSCESNTAFHVFQALMVDHPEFFFLQNSFLYTLSSSGKVDKLFLLYTDGTVEDQYDKRGKAVSTADRGAIDKQISAFSTRMGALAAQIDTETDVWGIEKQLHDLVIDEVAYDSVAAREANSESASPTHAFDVYGAACEGKAVCEGYSKLFQILCYRFGLNCTTVSGTVEEGGHMWNAVKPDQDWMMVDVTWDDAKDNGLRYYIYFNPTAKQMSADHKVESDLSVPSCDSEEGAFSKRFAFSVKSLTAAPENYKEVLDRLAAGSDGFVCMTVNGSEQEMSRYIHSQIRSSRSSVQKYLAATGYGIQFTSEIYIVEDYLYLIVKRD